MHEVVLSLQIFLSFSKSVGDLRPVASFKVWRQNTFLGVKIFCFYYMLETSCDVINRN